VRRTKYFGIDFVFSIADPTSSLLMLFGRCYGLK